MASIISWWRNFLCFYNASRKLKYDFKFKKSKLALNMQFRLKSDDILLLFNFKIYIFIAHLVMKLINT